MQNQLTIARPDRVICEECGNADSASTFLSSVKLDDRLSKDNLKFYRVRWTYGDGNYPKISLNPGDVVITEALGIDIALEGKKYKIFDMDYIVAKMGESSNDI